MGAPQIPDPRDDYAYGNNVAAFSVKARPWYAFMFGNQIPTAGAMAYGNVSQRLVPRNVIGSAIGQAIQFRTLYNVFPISQQYGLAAQTGLGGLAHGQVALQPLSDPYNGTY
jgi:hypothetical protein